MEWYCGPCIRVVLCVGAHVVALCHTVHDAMPLHHLWYTYVGVLAILTTALCVLLRVHPHLVHGPYVIPYPTMWCAYVSMWLMFGRIASFMVRAKEDGADHLAVWYALVMASSACRVAGPPVVDWVPLAAWLWLVSEPVGTQLERLVVESGLFVISMYHAFYTEVHAPPWLQRTMDPLFRDTRRLAMGLVALLCGKGLLTFWP